MKPNWISIILTLTVCGLIGTASAAFFLNEFLQVKQSTEMHSDIPSRVETLERQVQDLTQIIAVHLKEDPDAKGPYRE